jgi:hypothetical protein
MSQNMWVLCGVLLTFGMLSSACQAGGVGDPCTPEDEYTTNFPGYEETEVNTESKSFQCETRLCLVNHFRGRVSCPYGQSEAAANKDTAAMKERNDIQPEAGEPSYCHVPGTSDEGHRITIQVNAQIVRRRAEQAVYCSCRCSGADPNAKYCSCPSGYVCEELIQKNEALGAAELSGSYCIKAGTKFNVADQSSPRCEAKSGSTPPGECGNWDGQ